MAHGYPIGLCAWATRLQRCIDRITCPSSARSMRAPLQARLTLLRSSAPESVFIVENGYTRLRQSQQTASRSCDTTHRRWLTIGGMWLGWGWHAWRVRVVRAARPLHLYFLSTLIIATFSANLCTIAATLPSAARIAELNLERYKFLNENQYEIFEAILTKYITRCSSLWVRIAATATPSFRRCARPTAPRSRRSRAAAGRQAASARAARQRAWRWTSTA